MKVWLILVVLFAAPVWADEPRNDAESVALLKRMSVAARTLPYEGIFVMQMGDRMQTVQVENIPSGAASESRLVVLDGQPREVRCMRSESVTLAWNDKGQQLERRVGSRHFPDLLPENIDSLLSYYTPRLGNTVRVAGQDCRIIDLVPKDEYRWGYRLCAEQYTGLPLKAEMIGENNRPLLQYAFVKVREGAGARIMPMQPLKAMPAGLRPVQNSPVAVRQLPPGYSRLLAIKRKLPNRDIEVEHWIFSDGLNHISMFVEAAPSHLVNISGHSSRGLMNLDILKLGNYQITILGDAPLAAVDYIAHNLAVSDKP